MDKAEVETKYREIIQQHGPWTAHDIDLGHGFTTMSKGLHQQWRVDWTRYLIETYSSPSSKVLRFLNSLGLAKNSRSEKIRNKRILDLASLEGLFTIEFAKLGATTTGLEIRDVHLAKARFAQETLNLRKCRFVQGDVRKIPPELGKFDIIICAGILYHLDFPDCVTFLKDIAKRSTDIVILDSHLAYDNINDSVLPLTEMREYTFQDQTFRGRAIIEHAEHVTGEEKAKSHVWASIDNNISVWLAEEDVVHIMQEQGFRLILKEYPNDVYRENHADRPTLVFKR